METGNFRGFEVAVHDPGIALIAMNQPERLNGTTQGMKRDLVETLLQAQMDDRVRVVVITGSGRAFSAGDDMSGEDMSTPRTFPKALAVPADHTVVFSWVVYASKAERKRILKQVMTDPRLAAMMQGKDHPFDPKQMLYGGFNVIVDMAPNAAPKRAKKKAPPPKKRAKKKKASR